MTGTHVSANQGGCTCWCEDCGESHNCESWSQDYTLRWLKDHAKKCPAARRRRIEEALDCLRPGDLPKELTEALRALTR